MSSGVLGFEGGSLHKILKIILPLLKENGTNEDIDLIKKTIEKSIANVSN